MPDDLDLPALKALLAQWTQGPWTLESYPCGCDPKCEHGPTLVAIPPRGAPAAPVASAFVAIVNAAPALIDRLERAEAEVNAYHELIMAVAKKWSGESRHETALRYIRQAEAPGGDASQPGRDSNDHD